VVKIKKLFKQLNNDMKIFIKHIVKLRLIDGARIRAMKDRMTKDGRSLHSELSKTVANSS
jgi:hypothetical protein